MGLSVLFEEDQQFALSPTTLHGCGRVDFNDEDVYLDMCAKREMTERK